MKRWGAAGLMLFSLGALASAFIIAHRRQLPSVSLEPGFELRLNKIALGEKKIEPWENLPEKLLSYVVPSKFKPSRPATSNRSLEIHLGKFDSMRSKFVASKLRDPIVFFPDGTFNRGTVLNSRSNVVRVEFASYPRADKQIRIQLTEGERKVAFLIPNPHRAAKQNWRPLAFPQTNRTGQMTVVLQESDDPNAPYHLTSHSGTREPQAWTQWNIELHDAYGNWTRLHSNGRRVSRRDCWLMGDCFKLVARGREYISAGMVSVPETNSIVKLTPGLRAIDLGLQTAFLLGPGTYQLTETEAQCAPVGQFVQTNSLTLTEDTLEARTILPSILIVRKRNFPFLESINARLRERQNDERKSKYFHSRKEIAVTNDNAGVVVTLFPLPVSTSEDQLEAEIIAAHRAVEFFVAAKPSASAK